MRTDDSWLDLAPGRLRRAKQTFATRHVDLSRAAGLVTAGTPHVGDLVLARVASLGHHVEIELTTGRRATIFPGDEIVVAYGHRYAPDQYHALVPNDLGPCDLAAAGGLAARVDAQHRVMASPTTLLPLGLVVDVRGERLNLRDGIDELVTVPDGPRPLTVAVLGTSMNAGKTTTAAYLVRGFALAGMQVGAAKITGTGAGRDTWLFGDAGAQSVYDFTHAGVPSTYGIGAHEVRRVMTHLTARLAADGCEVVVLEVSDGVYQRETAALLEDETFLGEVDAIVLAACSAAGASGAVAAMADRGVEPVAITGVVTSSPLASAEAEQATGREIWTLDRLSDPDHARQLVADLEVARARSEIVEVA